MNPLEGPHTLMSYDRMAYRGPTRTKATFRRKEKLLSQQGEKRGTGQVFSREEPAKTGAKIEAQALSWASRDGGHASHLSNRTGSVMFSRFCTASSRTGAHSRVIVSRTYLESRRTFRAPCAAFCSSSSAASASSISLRRRLWRGSSSDSRICPGDKGQGRCSLSGAPNLL